MRRAGVVLMGPQAMQNEFRGQQRLAGVLGRVSLSWPAPGLARGQPLHACGGWLCQKPKVDASALRPLAPVCAHLGIVAAELRLLTSEY